LRFRSQVRAVCIIIVTEIGLKHKLILTLYLDLYRAVVLGAQAIQLLDAEIVVVGGQESMSQAHHSMHLRSGIKMGNGSLVDTMLTDGLTDAFQDMHMGITGMPIL